MSEFSEFASKGRGELRTSVRDNFVEEKGSNSLGSDGFLRWAKDYPLSKAMVDHDQKGIEAGREGQIGDEIAGKLLERTRCGRCDG